MWGESTYVDALVHNSLLELNGVICKHLRDVIRTSFVPFELPINYVSQDIHIVAYLVDVADSLRVFTGVIIVDTSLFATTVVFLRALARAK